MYDFHSAKMVITDTKQTTIIENYKTEYKDSLWKKSSVLLDYIEDWTRLNQFEIFKEQENNVVLNENSVDIKPCINRESKSDELTV